MKRSVFAMTFGAAIWAAACGGSQSGPSGGASLRVMMKDSPYSDARSLLVTITEISVHRGGDETANGGNDSNDNGGEWMKIPLAGGNSVMCDLKKLETVQRTIGSGDLQPGRYTQVRLTVSAAALYFDNAASGDACAVSIEPPPGRSAPLIIPSGVLKLNRGFTISANDTTTILLDFDGDKSVHETGNGRFMMQPVIAIVSVD